MSSASDSFATARFQTDRQAFNRFLSSRGIDGSNAAAKAAAKAEFNALTPLLNEGVRHLSQSALANALGPAVANITSTVWAAVNLTYGGIRCVGTWADYGAWHEMLAQSVAAKGEGIAYNPTTNSDGHRCNESTMQMTALNLDADGTGDWVQLWGVLMSLGLAALGHRSGGHQEELPKWRMILPLSEPFDTSTPAGILAWRATYATARTAFGALAGLLGPGFDPVTDGPHHPWFPGSRRSPNDAPRQVFQTHGATLDLKRLVERLPLAAQLTPRMRRIEGPSQRASPSLLELAFEEAEMLGPALAAGKRAVVCPWNDSHTRPLQPSEGPTSSTVIWPSSSAANIGGFSCAHSCGNAPIDLVLDALPADAVWRARQRHLGEQGHQEHSGGVARLSTHLPRLSTHLNGSR